MKNKLIGLLDCNNFFVSCERLFRPDLEGRPVLVLSSNDGCVVARSQEVKDIGIPMGVPYFQIKDIIKDNGITTFSSHFALYRDLSRRVFSVMREHLDTVEQYSIDEAFFEIDVEDLEEVKKLRDVIKNQVGIPVSIGIAATKTQAKYASSLAKKNGGFCYLNREEWSNLTPEIPLPAIWGVGRGLEMSLKKHGLITVSDLLEADSARVQVIFGVVGLRLQKELKGERGEMLSRRSGPQQSILSSRSFKETTEDIEVLADSVAYHTRHAAEDLRGMGMKTSSIRVFIRPSRHGDFVLRGGSLEYVFDKPVSDTVQLLKAANKLLGQIFETGVPYKKAGICLNNLSFPGMNQTSLFYEGEVVENEDLMSVVDKLNAGVNGELIKIGTRLRTKEWQARSETRSKAYTTSWKDLAEVKA